MCGSKFGIILKCFYQSWFLLVLIPKHMLASWEKVLAMVTEKDHLRTGAVHRYVLHS